MRSDPAAQWTGAHKGHAFFAYADNYLIDLKAAIIVDVEATRAIRQAEVGAARTMIESAPKIASGSVPSAWLPTVPTGQPRCWEWLVNERRESSRTFRCSTSRLATMGRLRAETSTMIRKPISTSVQPARSLTSTGTLVNDGATLLYRASKYDCDACEFKPRCCPKMPCKLNRSTQHRY